MLKSFFCWILIVMIALAGYASTAVAEKDNPPAGAKIAPFPDPKPGSQWTLRYSNGSEKITLLSAVKDGRFFSETHGRVYTTEWNIVEGPSSRTNAWFVYSPHVRTFSFPLWEGKKWGGWVTWTSTSRPFNGSFSVEGEAQKWEIVVVPAGTFETIRVENVVDGKPWCTCWYAIEAKYSIRCTFPQFPYMDYELVEYKLK